MTKTLRNTLVPAALALFAAACGSNGTSLTTNLKPVFFRTMGNAPVATFTLQRASGAAISSGRVVVDTHATFNGWMRVGRSTTASANGGGVASVALPAATYALTVQPGNTGSNVGFLNDTLSISTDTARTYQTSQQTWNITAPKPMAMVEVAIYQVDGNGKASRGSQYAQTNPLVLDVFTPAPGGSATSMSVNTELFKGSYRAVIIATPATSTDVIAPLETSVFASAGAGGAVDTHAITLTSSGNVFAANFVEAAGGAVPDADIGQVAVFDAGTLIQLNAGSTTNGAVALQTGNVSNVVVIVNNRDGSVAAAQTATASSAGTPVSFTRYVVSGKAAPATGSIVPTGTQYGTVTAQLRSSLGADWTTSAQGAVAAQITDALGTYQLKLFAGSYDLKAVNVPALANSTTTTLNVSAATTQNLTVSAGGVFAGNVQDVAKNNLTNVSVVVYDANHNYVVSGATDVNGNFSLPVAFGTYDVLVGGALHGNQSVSAQAPTSTMNLTSFQITGRLVDGATNPVAGRIYSGANTTTASTLGTYTVSAVEGVNWFLFAPPSSSPSLAFAYETAVEVDANTVKSLQ